MMNYVDIEKEDKKTKKMNLDIQLKCLAIYFVVTQLLILSSTVMIFYFVMVEIKYARNILSDVESMLPDINQGVTNSQKIKERVNEMLPIVNYMSTLISRFCHSEALHESCLTPTPPFNCSMGT